MKHLFLLTISPVQSFIEQARKTSDLYAGSCILSDLTQTGIIYLINNKHITTEDVIFPVKNTDTTSNPNRFLVTIKAEETVLSQLGNDVEKAVREKFKKLADTCFVKNVHGQLKTVQEAFDNQIQGHLEVYWVFHPLDTENYAQSYQKIEQLLSAIKNTRRFEQLPEKGRKCSLDGERNALFFGKGTKPYYLKNKTEKPHAIVLKEIDEVILAENEGLSAVSFLKRFYDAKAFPSTCEIALAHSLSKIDTEVVGRFESVFSEKNLLKLAEQEREIKINTEDWAAFNEQYFYEENLISKYIKNSKQLKLAKKYHQKLQEAFAKAGVKFDKYYAILSFDGDKMGEKLSKATSPDDHRAFSAIMSEFAAEAKSEFTKKVGEVVYAGGDDFLAFVNLHALGGLLDKLHELFQKKTQHLKAEFLPFTFSAGVAITHYKTPLNIVLQRAKAMEKYAKNEANRDAFAIAVLKHSGETHQLAYKWEQLSTFKTILTHLVQNHFSTTFIENIQREFQDFETSFIRRNKNLMRTETQRLLKRSQMPDFRKDKKLTEEMTDKVFLLQIESIKNTSFENFCETLNILKFLKRETKQTL